MNDIKSEIEEMLDNEMKKGNIAGYALVIITEKEGGYSFSVDQGFLPSMLGFVEQLKYDMLRGNASE